MRKEGLEQKQLINFTLTFIQATEKRHPHSFWERDAFGSATNVDLQARSSSETLEISHMKSFVGATIDKL